MDKYQVYVPKLISGRESIVSGHRACQGCAEVLAVRYVLKALGRNTVIANATGCMEIISSAFPSTAWEVPWIHVAFENAAAVASGVEAGLKVLMRKGRIPKKYIKAVAMGGDGGTSDIGLQALSGALERGHDMIYCCFDNEAYMNTGIQRSSSTPFGAMTTTSPPGQSQLRPDDLEEEHGRHRRGPRHSLRGHGLLQLPLRPHGEGGEGQVDSGPILHPHPFDLPDGMEDPFRPGHPLREAGRGDRGLSPV